MPSITNLPPSAAQKNSAPSLAPLGPLPPGLTSAVSEPKNKRKKKATDTKEVEQVAVPTVEPPPERAVPVVYPALSIEVCAGRNAITEKDAEIILGWLNEGQYQSRMMAKRPGTNAKDYDYGEIYMLRDAEKNKVRCANNLDNRPFDEKWCDGLAQTILKFQWAGTITMGEQAEYTYGKVGMEAWTDPLGTKHEVGTKITMSAGSINGSSVNVSRTGRLMSGQHTLCGLKKACQLYRIAPRGTYPQWDAYLAAHAGDHEFGPNGPAPVVETMLITGLSEDERVLMSVDNCKPRTEEDVFYTSAIFVKQRDFPAKRKEMSRMLAACVDMFWRRTARQGYKTHSEVMQLVTDHPRLIKSIEHLFAENASVRRINGKMVGGYLISNLGLSAGQMSCLMYVMGSSASDGDDYRNGNPPREKGLDWSRWEEARAFFSALGESTAMTTLRKALMTHVIREPDWDDPMELTGGLLTQTRLALLAKAWQVWVTERKVFTELDLAPGGCLHLHYTPASTDEVQQEDGSVRVVETPARLMEDAADFGGIDVPDKVGAEPLPMTEDEMTAAREQVAADRALEDKRRIDQMRSDDAAAPVATRPNRPKLTS